jgi:hypothetical protein
VQSGWQEPLQQTKSPKQVVLLSSLTQVPLAGSQVWQMPQVTLAQMSVQAQVLGSCVPLGQVTGSQTQAQLATSKCLPLGH